MIDLIEVDDLFTVSDGFEHGRDAEVASAAQDAFGRADDEINSIIGEGIVAELNNVELAVDEVFHIIRVYSGHLDGIGDTAFDVLVDDEMQFLHELRLSKEDEIVIFREVLEEEPEFSQAFHIHEMGIVDDRDEHFTFMVDLPCGLNEEFFALGVTSIGFYFKCGAEDVESVGICVKCAGDGRSDHVFRVMIYDCVFDDAFACAWFAHNDAKSALLGMDLDSFEDFPLMRQQRRFLLVEGILFYSEV
jgi:hypothetical protein